MSTTEQRRCPYQPGREPKDWAEPVTVFDPHPDYEYEIDTWGSDTP